MKAISKKLLEFQKNINAIKKDGKNPHFKSNYATLPQILCEVKPILSDIGLVLLQPIKGKDVLTQIIDSESGECMEGSITLQDGLNPQQTGSAITYYRRYLLAGMLSLEIEDDDGNDASKTHKPMLNIGTDIYKHAVQFLKDGHKIEAIEAKYKMSKETREQLISDSI